jgi:hypothetical protein
VTQAKGPESMTSTDRQHLKADAKRQAADILRGYFYQIWWTVDAWISLRNDELLVVEGAEDFEVLGRNDATTTQVKNLTANLTLRSKPALDAIRSFWTLKEDPRYRIRFCFLTSSRAGIEKGNPLGPGLAGMHAWNLASHRGDGIPALRDFLLTLDLPTSLKDFLRTASPEAIKAQLLVPFEWQLDQGSSEDVQAKVRRSLILYGEQTGIPPDDAEGVADHLFAAACAIASRKTGRDLHKADFLKLWREETARRMNFAELRLAALEFGVLIPGTPGPAITSFPHQLLSDPPPLPVRHTPRSKLVATLRNTLSTTGQLILTGTVCTGKTTLAKLLAADGWLWVDLAHVRGAHGLLALQALARRLDAGPPPAAVVIDCSADLSEESILHASAFGDSLRRLQRAAIPFIVTAPRPLPSKTVALLDLPAASLITAPPLVEEEIVELLAVHGCPSHLQHPLAQALALRTAGHPQLIAAWSTDLAASNWQVSHLAALAQPPTATEQILAEARTLLSALPESIRTLADRLSLLSHPFRRDQALAIGALSPAVPRPGESFDRLDGSWIERLAGDYYGISPLLSDAAAKILPPSDVTTLHGSLAHIFLHTPPLTQIEAAAGFFHAFRGEEASTVVQLAADLLRAKASVQRAAFPALRWFAFVGLAGGFPPFLAGPHTPMLRVLQYRLALGDKHKLRIVALWDEEIRSAAGPPQRALIDRLLFTASLLMDHQVRHDIAQLFDWLHQAGQAADSLRTLDPSSPVGLLKLDPGSPAPPVDIATGLFPFLLARCATINDLSAVIDNLEHLDDTFRARLLKVFDLYPGFAQQVLDRSRRRVPEANRAHCLEVLSRVAAAAALWGHEKLRQAAICAKASVLAQIDPEAALDLLRHNRPAAGNAALLDNKEASLLQQRGDHAAAWAIWRTGLPRWAADGDFDEVAQAFAMEEAATSAARFGEWDEAARLFIDASRLLRAQNTEEEPSSPYALLPLRFAIEHAYALARASRWRESVAAFDGVLSELSEIAAAPANLDDFRITCKLLGHILLWLYNPGLVDELPSGTVSWLRVSREALSLPPTSIEHLWGLLCQLESAVTGASGILDRMRSSLSTSNDWQVRFFLHTSEIAICLRTGQLEGLVPHLAALSDVSNVFYLLNRVFFGFLAWLCLHPGADPPWGRWRTDLLTTAAADATHIDEWLELAQHVLRAPFHQVRTLFADPHLPQRPFLAARIATTPLDSPDLLFQAHRFLVLCLPPHSLFPHESDVIATTVQSSWLHLLERTPLLDLRLTAPATRQACQHPRPGLSRAAAILLAVAPGLSTHLDQNTRKALEDLRDPP